jgi:hypothetical protein
MDDGLVTGALAGTRPRRILFFLYHAGYLRHYVETLRLLSERGYVVHLSFTVVEKDRGDRALAERVASEIPGVTFDTAPRRAFLDGWRRTSVLVRAFTDLTRYASPEYANATGLRDRMARKIESQIVTAKTDPASRWILKHLVVRLEHLSSPASVRRVQRALATAEQAIPTSRRVDAYIRAFGPDAVLVTPLVDFASVQVDYLKSAASLGIPTGVAVASWDNLTNKGLLRFLPDRVLIWNETQRRELERFHGVPGERAITTGAPKFDEWFERRPARPPADFAKHVGLDPRRPFLLYVCSSAFIAPHEVSFVRHWIERLRASSDQRLADIGVLVRPHPQNAAQWCDVDLSAYGNAVVWPRSGSHPDVGEARAGFFDSLAHSAAVVGINTSAMIEAAIVGKNVLTISDPAFASTQEGTLHFHYLLRENGGFLRVAASLDDHEEQLRAILDGGESEVERVEEFVRDFVRPHGLDIPASSLVAQAIDELAASGPVPRPRPTPEARLWHVLLLVPTAVASASALVGWIAFQLRRVRRGPAFSDRAEVAAGEPSA